MLRQKDDAPVRSVTEITTGDYVKVGSRWQRVASNSAAGENRTPRDWTVQLENGASRGPMSINRYAKAEDIEEE
jgi:hypothetical protein